MQTFVNIMCIEFLFYIYLIDRNIIYRYDVVYTKLNKDVFDVTENTNAEFL